VFEETTSSAYVDSLHLDSAEDQLLPRGARKQRQQESDRVLIPDANMPLSVIELISDLESFHETSSSTA